MGLVFYAFLLCIDVSLECNTCLSFGGTQTRITIFLFVSLKKYLVFLVDSSYGCPIYYVALIPDAGKVLCLLSSLLHSLRSFEAWAGIEPARGGFAVPSVTTSPPGHTSVSGSLPHFLREGQWNILVIFYFSSFFSFNTSSSKS